MIHPGARGLDHAGRPADYRAFAREAVAKGFEFEFRYLCDPNERTINQSKVLRPGEAQTAMEEGLTVLLIWQNTKSDALGGYAAGYRHGQWAAYQALMAGAPSGTTIYFAIGDYDVQPVDYPVIDGYLRGVRDGMGGRYGIGGYGKRACVEEFQNRGMIGPIFQSYGFSRPIGEISPRAAVYQHKEQATIAGILCDVDEAFVWDAGEWRSEMRVARGLIDALRREGIAVPEHSCDGKSCWGRGADMSAVNGLVWHDTVTPATMSDKSLRDLLFRGRSDLPGPLCQFGVERDGEMPLIADGKANHNGYGTWGNQAIGMEAANNGVGEPFPNAQYDRWLRASAVICLYYRKSPDAFVKGHKETDPARKVDPVGINMNSARAAIALHMLRISGFQPGPAPAPPPPYTVVKRGLRLNQLRSPLMRISYTVTTDDMGRGWVPLDGAGGRPRVPFGDLISVRPQGSNPQADGYWPIPETGEQDHGGMTLLTVEGGPPKGQVTLFLVVPDA